MQTRTDVAWKTIMSLQQEMALDGMLPISPSNETERLDRLIWEFMPCPECEGDVVLYPFFKREPRTYKLFLVCVKCGGVENVGGRK